MIEEYGIVIAIDESTQQVWVDTQSKQACGHCQSQRTCGTGQVTQFFADRAKALLVDNRHNAKVGDTVRLGIADNALLYSALNVYLLPLLGLLLGASIYTWQATEPNDAWSLFSAILGMLAGMGLSRYLQQRQNPETYQVLMLAVESN